MRKISRHLFTNKKLNLKIKESRNGTICIWIGRDIIGRVDKNDWKKKLDYSKKIGHVIDLYLLKKNPGVIDFGVEDEELIECNPLISSAAISTSNIKMQSVQEAHEDYDAFIENGDFEDSYEILKMSLITRLNEMHITQNPDAEIGTPNLFSIIKKSRNFLEKSGLIIEDTIDIYIEKMKIFDDLVEDGGFITPSLYDQIEDIMVDIYMEFKWKFKENEIMD